MSVYPVLQIDSLKARCSQDIQTFVKQVLGGKPNSILAVQYELYTGADYEGMNNAMKSQLAIMNPILQSHNETIQSFDYSHDILHFNEQQRNQLWIIRTLLCYQMMIFGTHIMSDSSLHAKVYGASTFQRTFRPEVIDELPSFKLGIFGSITPTSDIDIGIQYSGMTPGFAALDYVVATMEDMYIIFLGIESTLKLDIEYYADMMTLPNPNTTNTASPDLFYLDTLFFTEDDFNQMLPYAYASIYRNYLTAKKDLANNKINKNETDFISRLQKYGVSVDEIAMNDAKQKVSSYMVLSYSKAREEYYKLVRIAEKQVADIREYIQAGNYQALTNKLIVDTMKAIAHALVFRAESYVCAPTVMHVVRLLQADPKREKYPVTYPTTCHALPEIRLKNPQCEIGYYGYEMSRLEQIGYILRFQMTYCDNNRNSAKCKKKLDKYQSRLDDAIARKMGISNSIGGRRKKSYSIRKHTQRNLRRKNHTRRARRNRR